MKPVTVNASKSYVIKTGSGRLHTLGAEVS
mgnify:CR=1 FL=1